jgi:hypothetical protein
MAKITLPAVNGQPATSWRNQIKIHPAAELTPLMSDAELVELGEDIIKIGRLREIPVLSYDGQLADGRNRLDAMERVGISFEIKEDKRGKFLTIFDEGINVFPDHFFYLDKDEDIYAYVISANLRRLHLTAEKKREAIARSLKRDPSKSDRQVARAAGADHKTVAAVRAESEATGEIPQLKERKGKDGKTRKQPASKPRGAKSKPKTDELTDDVEASANARKTEAARIEEQLGDPDEPPEPDRPERIVRCCSCGAGNENVHVNRMFEGFQKPRAFICDVCVQGFLIDTAQEAPLLFCSMIDRVLQLAIDCMPLGDFGKLSDADCENKLSERDRILADLRANLASLRAFNAGIVEPKHPAKPEPVSDGAHPLDVPGFLQRT